MNKMFVLQRQENGLMDDYVNRAGLALDEYCWLHPEEAGHLTQTIVTSAAELPSDYFCDELVVPIGGIRFCEDIFRRRYGMEYIRPINIPEQLMFPQSQFTKRRVAYVRTYEEWNRIYSWCQSVCFPENQIFVKRADRCKIQEPFFFGPGTREKVSFGKGEVYLVSEFLDIKTEWRVFVFRNKILDVRKYGGGNPWKMPNRAAVQEMVTAYKDAAPPAYTLDVAVLADGDTALLEIHNFIACGLYGFDDPKLIPMLCAGVQYELDHIF